MDLVGPLKTSKRNNRYILVIQDAFTKWISCIPLKTGEATEVSQQFITHWVTVYGVPAKILTDRGSNFLSRVFKDLCGILGTQHTTTTAYRPQANGSNERTHRELKRFLGMYISPNENETRTVKIDEKTIMDVKSRDWDKIIPIAASTYNNTFHAILKSSPYELVFGMPTPNYALGALSYGQAAEEKLQGIDVDDQLSDEDVLQRYTSMTQNQLRAVRKKTADMLQKAQDKWRVQLDGDQRKLPEFQEGDFILLKNMKAKTNHFQPLYLGPYRVIQKKSPIAYVIKREEPHFKRDNYMDIVHIDRMKHYHFDPRVPVQPIYQVDDEEEADDEEEGDPTQLWIPEQTDKLQEAIANRFKSTTRVAEIDNAERIVDNAERGTTTKPLVVTHEPDVRHKGPVTRSMTQAIKDQVKSKWKRIWKPKVNWTWVDT